MGDAGGSSAAWPRVKKFLGGWCSGVSLVLAGHPFDTIKVRLQTEGRGGKFTGVMNCVTQTVTKEGFTGLYKGMAAPLVLTGFVNSALFGMQFNLCSEIVKNRGGASTDKATVKETMAAAVASGALISVLVTPMEGIKARLQVQYSTTGVGAKYSGPVDCARKVLQNEGLIRGIYRGWLPVTLCRMSNYSYFGSYAFISTKLAAYIHGDDPDAATKPLPVSASLLAGGSAGFCYWLSCYPIDVIKNKIQAATGGSSSMSQMIRHTYAKEGVRGFFVGFTPCVLRAFPANAAAFMGFEMAMRVLPD